MSGMNGKVTIVSNKGKGSTREAEIVKGMTAKEVLYAELGIQDPDKWLILVDGKTVTKPGSCVLHGGEFIIIVPTNVKTGR